MSNDIDAIKKQEKIKYYNDYFEKNKEKLKKDCICDVCGGKYKYMAKAHHIKTKKHVAILEMENLRAKNEKLKKILSDINDVMSM